MEPFTFCDHLFRFRVFNNADARPIIEGVTLAENVHVCDSADSPHLLYFFIFNFNFY